MPCPTCDHTLQTINRVDGEDTILHCPRCGTLQVVFEWRTETYVPKLVERCRQFATGLEMDKASDYSSWQRLGIAESINLPEGR